MITLYNIVSGKRACLGEMLARMEHFVFATALLQRYEFIAEDKSKLPSVDNTSLGVTLIPNPFSVKAVKLSWSAVILPFFKVLKCMHALLKTAYITFYSFFAYNATIYLMNYTMQLSYNMYSFCIISYYIKTRIFDSKDNYTSIRCND